MKQDVTIGYKYFAFDGAKQISLLLRGNGRIAIQIRLDAADGKCVAETKANLSGEGETITLATEAIEGVHALYLHFDSEKSAQFQELAF